MSTQKNLIRDKEKALRSRQSVYAEALISKACGWDIEFLSCGSGSLLSDDLYEITKKIYEITGQKQWLNFGLIDENELERLKPYTEGVTGTVECVNWQLREKLCPSKPVSDIIELFRHADRLGMKKAITIIIGLGETINDYSNLKNFIMKHGIERITFYSLNPHKGTPHNSSPDMDYYERWIAQTRSDFPGIRIIAGAWKDKTHYIPRLLAAGADFFTKLPALKIVGTKQGKEIDKMINMAGISQDEGLTDKPCIMIDENLFDETMLLKVIDKIKRYGFTYRLAKSSGELLLR